MNDTEKTDEIPFAENYWREEGGEKWVEYIDDTESALAVFNTGLLGAVEVSEGNKVLDIGCGGGVNSMELARRVGKTGSVVGVDISGPILHVARERGQGFDNLTFIEADAADLELEDAGYDLIFSRFGVMFFSDPDAAFANFRKALKPDGKMVFLCWRAMEENPWMSVPVKAVFEVIPPEGPPPDPDMPGPFSMSDEKQVRTLLQNAGFTDIGIDPLDIEMKLGKLEDASEYFMKMGPAASVILEATDDQRQRAKQAMEKAMAEFVTGEEFVAPAATWMVTAC